MEFYYKKRSEDSKCQASIHEIAILLIIDSTQRTEKR
jgi:hypothetical protein